jgi:endonuclease/exonuclease/phosphatase family metal-dependent hydrolase
MHHGKVSRDIALGLKELKKRIERGNIPSSKLDETMTLATWNIREFGKKPRMKASLHYIAEILGQFDLIAVTEVRENLADLAAVLQILGPYWRAVFSDYIQDAGGNRERVAYVYDERAVAFTGLAAEADAPRKKDKETGEYLPSLDWWRSPYIASFRAGNFDFVLVTVHIRWGKKAKDRIAPLKLLADWIEKRRKAKFGVDKDIILMGDFNIPRIGDRLYKAVTRFGLRMPKGLAKLDHGSNLGMNKRYDQILHCPTRAGRFTKKGGVLDFYTGGINRLYPEREMSKFNFTFQMSDHMPLWVELDTDIEGERLDQIIRPKRRARRR